MLNTHYRQWRLQVGGRPPDRLVALPVAPPPSNNCTIKIVELLYVSIGIWVCTYFEDSDWGIGQWWEWSSNRRVKCTNKGKLSRRRPWTPLGNSRPSPRPLPPFKNLRPPFGLSTLAVWSRHWVELRRYKRAFRTTAGVSSSPSCQIYPCPTNERIVWARRHWRCPWRRVWSSSSI